MRERPSQALYRQKISLDIENEYQFEAADYRFSPSSFVVKQGEVVRFVVNNAGKLPHEFELEALGVEALIQPGESVDVVVSADKPGRYALMCDLPGHLAAGMQGTLVVEPE